MKDERELRQSDVAKELGRSLSLYTDIENNRRRPFDSDTMDTFAEDLLPERITEVYGVLKRAASLKLRKNGFVSAAEMYQKSYYE